MKVKELMTKDPMVLSPETSVEQAAQAMGDADVGSLPVLKDGRLLGILTDRDIAVRVVGEGLPPAETRVEAVMTADVLVCSEDDVVEKAAEKMAERQVRRLAVVDAAGRFAGVVSLADITRASGGTAEEVLQEVSRPSEEVGQGVYAGGPAPQAAPSAAALVEEELAAAEAYKRLLQTIPDGRTGDELRRIENEHEEAARLLRERLPAGKPAGPKPSSGAWLDARGRLKEFADEKASIALLREEEVREAEDYQKALDGAGLDAGLRKLIATSLLPRTRRHADALAGFLGRGPAV